MKPIDLPFDYTQPALGDDFLSRKEEVDRVCGLLSNRQNVLIYDAPKTGKSSIIQQALLRLKREQYIYTLNEIDMQSIRDEETLFSCYLDNVSSDIPNLIVYFRNFQNILCFDDPDSTIKGLEKIMRDESKNVTFIICGSRLNAMRYIFEEHKYFYRFAEYVKISPIEEKAVSDRISKVFLRVGKVIEKEHSRAIYSFSEANPFYIWQIASQCFYLTKGYMNDTLIEAGIDSLLALYDSKFKEIIYGLSNYQFRFLRAVYDGVVKFSTNEIIKQYNLSSAANVVRLKEALKKKEVVAFNEKNEPYIIDPLFKYWLKKYYNK